MKQTDFVEHLLSLFVINGLIRICREFQHTWLTLENESLLRKISNPFTTFFFHHSILLFTGEEKNETCSNR